MRKLIFLILIIAIIAGMPLVSVAAADDPTVDQAVFFVQ
jgi:hypothetical protein